MKIILKGNGSGGGGAVSAITSPGSITAAEPIFQFNESDAGADGKLWDIDVNAGVFKIRSRTDADGAGETAMAITRSGVDIVSQAFNASTGFGFSKTGAAPTHFVDIVAGTLTSTQAAVNVTGTLSTTAANQVGVGVAIASTTGGTRNSAMVVTLNPGNAGAVGTYAGEFNNVAAGTGTSTHGSAANYGIICQTYNTTTGTNIGLMGYVYSGNINVGLAGVAQTNKNAATNIGVIGYGLNGGTTPIHIGGYFGLQSTEPTFTSAALMADNGATTSPVAVLRDNGTPFWTAADGGEITHIGKYINYGSVNNQAVNNRIYYGATTDAATAVELTSDGAAGSGATNRIAVPANACLSIVLNICVKQSGSANSKQMLRQVVITNNGGTTAIEGTVITLGTDSGSAGLATVTCTITANNTDDCLKIEVNGVAATNLRYTAYVVSSEVVYS